MINDPEQSSDHLQDLVVRYRTIMKRVVRCSPDAVRILYQIEVQTPELACCSNPILQRESASVDLGYDPVAVVLPYLGDEFRLQDSAAEDDAFELQAPNVASSNPCKERLRTRACRVRSAQGAEMEDKSFSCSIRNVDRFGIERSINSLKRKLEDLAACSVTAAKYIPPRKLRYGFGKRRTVYLERVRKQVGCQPSYRAQKMTLCF
jgi:hypothetical protein